MKSYKLAYNHLDLYHTLISGQTFEWTHNTHDEEWTGVIYNNPIILKQVGDKTTGYLEYFSKKNLDKEIITYFSLDQDYLDLINKISFDKHITLTLKKLHGLRVIRQDPWYCINAFILSQNNTVRNIQNAMRNISNLFSSQTFPTHEQLKSITIEQFTQCKTGYRAEYLIDFYNKYSQEKNYIENLQTLNYQDAKDKLMQIKGVGEKVADCILLYAFEKYEAYPIDTHLRHATHENYFASETKLPSDKNLREWAKEYWGDLAGFAHFFLFTYRRLYGKLT